MGLHENLRAALDEAGWAGPREHGRHPGHRARGHGPSESERGERRERRGGHGGPGGRGRPGHEHRHWQGSGTEQVSSADVGGWLAGRLPDGWVSGTPQISVDRDEIIIVVPLAAPEVAEPAAETDSAAVTAAAEAGRISRFREDTRDERVRIAREAEHRYGRKVAWGASAGESTELFTTMSVPVMTRLRQPERSVLDTLVDAGVARSRSDALAWCVRLVGEHTEDWLGQLREAMTAVERVRAEGPSL
ncbi:MAG TPA: hypothetical protein VHZ96_00575 [Frankiaceae bacterium]|nr:hypothetical protein [Frankiaceae bacterium]